MNILRSLFQNKLNEFEQNATQLILAANYTQLRILHLDLIEYIAKYSKDWSKKKFQRYQDLLEELNDIL